MAFAPSPVYPACDMCKVVIPPTNDHIQCTYCRVALCNNCQHVHGPGHRSALVISRAQPFMAASPPLSPPPCPISATPTTQAGWHAFPPTPQPSPYEGSSGGPFARHASVPFVNQAQHAGQGYPPNQQFKPVPWHQQQHQPLPSPPHQPNGPPRPQHYGPPPHQQPPMFHVSPPVGGHPRPGPRPQQPPQRPSPTLRQSKSQSSVSKFVLRPAKKILKGGLIIGGAALLGADLSDSFDGGDVDPGALDTSATDSSFAGDGDYGSGGDYADPMDSQADYGYDYQQDMSYNGDGSGGYSGDSNYGPIGDSGGLVDSQGDYGNTYQQPTGYGGDGYGDAAQQSVGYSDAAQQGGGYGDAAGQAIDTQTQQSMQLQNSAMFYAPLQACASMPAI